MGWEIERELEREEERGREREREGGGGLNTHICSYKYTKNMK